MAKPVLVVVDDDAASCTAVARKLESRYGADYEIFSATSADTALARLNELSAVGASVALILTDQWMPGMTGTQLLARVKEIVPTARRGLMVDWGDRSALERVVEAAALGGLEFYVSKPAGSPDEQFHRAVTESLEEWWRERGGSFQAVTVIGDEQSPRTHEIRDLLARNSVPSGFHPSDSDEGRRVLERLDLPASGGPVASLYNGVVLVDPDKTELAKALGIEVRPGSPIYDVVIAGAGPAGLAAAVYGASEGLSTALLEPDAIGGQAGTSFLIRNYLGFPRGVSGAELAWRAYEQAWVFGAQFIYGNPATSLSEDDGLRVVGLTDGSQVQARAVVIATGVSYRRLGVPELETLLGAGVFYGAGASEAKGLIGKPVFVIGGGNSAGEAALHLSRYASEVTMLVRHTSLAESMSDYLMREIGNASNIAIRYQTEVVGGSGNGHLQRILVRDRDSGRTETVPAAGLFILIGRQPLTEWLPRAIDRDRWGFVLTGPDVARRSPSKRAPFLFETSLPGVFAVGDGRRGSVKRVASAVGEGSVVIGFVREYLGLASSASAARRTCSSSEMRFNIAGDKEGTEG